jgi:transposase InsO family protein
MCKVLAVSRAGYYAWCARPESKRKIDDKRILAHIKTIFADSRDTYGYRRIHAALLDLNEIYSLHKILRLMRENNIRPKTRKKFKVTTDSKHNKPIHDNSLARQFNATEPNQRWVSDITYIPTKEGWLYLAVILDLYSRKVIGWAMSDRMKDQLVTDALKMALFRRKVRSNLLLHSDRGSQYASDNMQQLLRQTNITCSMSRKGNCWDNAVAESFFHSLKTECVYHEHYLTRSDAKNSIFDYIEVFYNRKRKHSYLGYRSPEQYELSCNV